jgi:hypothetical protein
MAHAYSNGHCTNTASASACERPGAAGLPCQRTEQLLRAAASPAHRSPLHPAPFPTSAALAKFGTSWGATSRCYDVHGQVTRPCLLGNGSRFLLHVADAATHAVMRVQCRRQQGRCRWRPAGDRRGERLGDGGHCRGDLLLQPLRRSHRAAGAAAQVQQHHSGGRLPSGCAALPGLLPPPLPGPQAARALCHQSPPPPAPARPQLGPHQLAPTSSPPALNLLPSAPPRAQAATWTWPPPCPPACAS